MWKENNNWFVISSVVKTKPHWPVRLEVGSSVQFFNQTEQVIKSVKYGEDSIGPVDYVQNRWLDSLTRLIYVKIEMQIKGIKLKTSQFLTHLTTRANASPYHIFMKILF